MWQLILVEEGLRREESWKGCGVQAPGVRLLRALLGALRGESPLVVFQTTLVQYELLQQGC